MKEFKKKVVALIQSELEMRAQTARTAMETASQSANEEEKSSAGDKYETSRAMGHLNSDMHAKQLDEANHELKKLASLHPENHYTQVEAGTLVDCEDTLVFIGIGIGKMNVDGVDVIAVSSTSPVAQALLGKKPNESATVNGRTYTIRSIE